MSPVPQASRDGDRLGQTAVMLQVHPCGDRQVGRYKRLSGHLAMLSAHRSFMTVSASASGQCRLSPAVSDISGREPGRASARGRGFRLRQALEIAALARARLRSRRDRLRLAWSRASGGWPATAAPRHARPLKHFRASASCLVFNSIPAAAAARGTPCLQKAGPVAARAQRRAFGLLLRQASAPPATLPERSGHTI